jgi:hypothetical protein
LPVADRSKAEEDIYSAFLYSFERSVDAIRDMRVGDRLSHIYKILKTSDLIAFNSEGSSRAIAHARSRFDILLNASEYLLLTDKVQLFRRIKAEISLWPEIPRKNAKNVLETLAKEGGFKI